MPVEKPRKSGRGPRPFRATIVVGGVHGDHGAGFSKKSLPCRFSDRNPQDSSKIWQGWSWQESLLLRPPACQKPFLISRKPIVADCLSRFRRSYNHPLNGWSDQARSGLSPAVALSRGRRVYCQLHSLLRESPFRGFVSLFIPPCTEQESCHYQRIHISHVAPAICESLFSCPQLNWGFSLACSAHNQRTLPTHASGAFLWGFSGESVSCGRQIAFRNIAATFLRKAFRFKCPL